MPSLSLKFNTSYIRGSEVSHLINNNKMECDPTGHTPFCYSCFRNCLAQWLGQDVCDLQDAAFFVRGCLRKNARQRSFYVT